MIKRRVSKQVQVGNTRIGGDAKITVQSMLNMPANDIQANIRQAIMLEAAGCEILRVAVPDKQAVQLIPTIKQAIKIPLVADIHFDYRLPLECAAAGVDKIRINPGNIGDMERIRKVAHTCQMHKIPIRIGVNAGSLEADILKKYGHPCAQALCESALYHARLLEQCDFEDIVLSIKASDVLMMIEAYELAAEQCNYPLHLGVTEAGTMRMGTIKSAIGIGSLLCKGIGDTIRVSLTDDPVQEIYAGKDILKSLGLASGVQLISCPTCGRTKIDLISLAKEAEGLLQNCDKDITVAVMGCVVNGPGEAREADIGIAGGNGEGLVFKKGKMIRKVPEKELLQALLDEIEKL